MPKSGDRPADAPRSTLHEGEGGGPMARFQVSLFRFALLFSVATSVLISASGVTGSRIRGRITDQSGALITAASVSLSSREGFMSSAKSDSKGAYEFTALTPGEYLLEVKML